jgi:hypothetical protein
MYSPSVMRVLAVFILSNSLTVYADQSIDTLQRLDQNEFRAFSEDLAAALSYKPVIPSEPLGVLGFDIGAEFSTTLLKNGNLFSKTALEWDWLDDKGEDYLGIARLHAHKGLPFNIDAGLSYATVINSNTNVWGAELRYALLQGSTLTPALAVRTAYTRMSGVEALDLATQSLDISTSKGFAMFTPYAGVGHVWTQSHAKNAPYLSDEDISQFKVYGGVNLGLTLFNLAAEYDNTGGISTFSLKLGTRF